MKTVYSSFLFMMAQMNIIILNDTHSEQKLECDKHKQTN